MPFATRIALALLLPAAVGAAQTATQPPATSTHTPTSQAPTTQAPASQPGSAPAELPDSPASQTPTTVEPTGPTAVMDTSMGRITCRLFDKQAPQTVANFIGLADGTKDWTDPATREKVHGRPLYSGTPVHRVIPGFMIQGGDPLGSGLGDPGYYVPDEISPGLNFDLPGRLAMANSGPNTDGSQFFVTEAVQPHLDGHYTIFGQCDPASVDVVKSIARVERDPGDKPLTPVVLKQITIVPGGQAVPAAAAATPSAAPAPH